MHIITIPRSAMARRRHRNNFLLYYLFFVLGQWFCLLLAYLQLWYRLRKSKQEYGVEMTLDFDSVHCPTSYLRGHHRRLEETNDEENFDQPSEHVEANDVVSSILAFMMGFVSSVMLCAFYFILIEVKERCWKAKEDEYPLPEPSLDPRGFPSGTSLNGRNGLRNQSSHGNSSSGSTKHNAQRLESEYPSIQSTRAPSYPDRLHLDDISMSQLSAMTESVAFDGKSKSNKLKTKTKTRTITLLDDEHRVPSVTKLQTLVNLSEIPASSISSSRSFVSAKAASVTADSGSSVGRDKAMPIDLYQVDNLGAFQETRSVMTDGSGDKIQGLGQANETSIDEDSSIEDESGWTSSAGQSDSSSDMSVATFLKSICSAKSLSSIRSKTAKPCLEDSLGQTSDKECFGADDRDDVDSQTDGHLVDGIVRDLDSAHLVEELGSKSRTNVVSVGSIKGPEQYPSQHSRKDDANSLIVSFDGSSEDFKESSAEEEDELLKISTETESHLPHGIMQYKRFRVAVKVLSHKEAYEGDQWCPLTHTCHAGVDAFEWGREMLQQYRPEHDLQDDPSSLTENTTTIVRNILDDDHDSSDVMKSSGNFHTKHDGMVQTATNVNASSNGSLATA